MSFSSQMDEKKHSWELVLAAIRENHQLLSKADALDFYPPPTSFVSSSKASQPAKQCSYESANPSFCFFETSQELDVDVSLGGGARLSSLLGQEYSKTVVPKEVADQDELLCSQKSVLIPVSVDSETASEADEADCFQHEVATPENKVPDLTNNEGTATSAKKVSSGLTAAVKPVVKNC